MEAKQCKTPRLQENRESEAGVSDILEEVGKGIGLRKTLLLAENERHQFERVLQLAGRDHFGDSGVPGKRA